MRTCACAIYTYMYMCNLYVHVHVQFIRTCTCAGSALQRLLEAVTEARKLDVENGHQWKQTKHLLKYIKNQERELAKTER